MPIKLLDKLISGSGDPLIDASLVETTSGDTAQGELDDLQSSILSWKYKATVTDASNPGAGFLALNSATKDDTTIVSFNTQSNTDSSRFDEPLTRLGVNDGLYLQQRDAANTSIFFRVTGVSEINGTKVNVPVERERDQGGEFTADAVLNVTFFFSGITSATPTPGNPNLDSRVSTLETKMDGLYPLTTDVADLTEWADIYDPERASSTVEISRGYSLLADFRGAGDRYESSGVTYDDTGVDVVRYTGLTSDLHRAFGFKVTAAANQTLLWLVDGSGLIPFIDMTSAGNFRINNYTPEHAGSEEVSNRLTFLTRSAGTQLVTTAGGSVSTFTIPDYPASATNTSRTVEFDVDVYLNGTNTGAGGGIFLDTPNENEAQAKRTLTHQFNLGPLHGNATPTLTFGYEFRISGADLLLDMTLETAPSGYSVDFGQAELLENFTAATTVSRVDDWEIFQDGLGDYTFSGEQEFLVAFQPFETLGTMDAVSAAVGTGSITELNDRRTIIPETEFSSVEIPDTIEFRTFESDHFFRHADLSHLLTNRAVKWAYGLARLRSITDHAVSEAIDLASGTTVNSQEIYTPASTFFGQANATEVFQAADTSSLIQTTALPADYATYDFVSITVRTPGPPVEWRTSLISTKLLADTDLQVTDLIRGQGNTDFTWTVGTRALVQQTNTEIWRVELVRSA